MRLRDRLMLIADRLASTLLWWSASHHLRTDPACAEYVSPSHGSRLDRLSRGVGCTRCMKMRAFGFMPASDVSSTGGDRG